MADTKTHRHVFADIPNTKSHRAAIERLRPYLNTEAYRMRVRGRGRKNGHAVRTSWGDVHLEDAARLSIYLDSQHERHEMLSRYTANMKLDEEKRAHQTTCDRALEDIKRLHNEACDLKDQCKALEQSRTRLASYIAEQKDEIARVPAWIRRFFAWWRRA